MEVLKPRIIVLGHIGAGSVYGMTAKEGWTTDDGKITIKPNKYQRWLRKLWDEAKEKFRTPNVLVVLGEPIEGTNPHGFGEDIQIPRIEDQIDLDVELLDEWIGEDTEEVLLTFSHTYHGLNQERVEAQIAKLLRERHPDINIEYGVLFYRQYHGLTVRFIHGSTGAFVYRVTERGRRLKINREEAAIGKAPLVNLEVIAHTHADLEARMQDDAFLSVPCMKLRDTYASFKNPDAFNPDIGITIIEFMERYGKVTIEPFTLRAIPPFDFEGLKKLRTKKTRIGWGY